MTASTSGFYDFIGVGEGWGTINTGAGWETRALSSIPVPVAFRIVVPGGFLELDVRQHVPHGCHEPVHPLVEVLPCSGLVISIVPDVPLQESRAGGPPRQGARCLAAAGRDRQCRLPKSIRLLCNLTFTHCICQEPLPLQKHCAVETCVLKAKVGSDFACKQLTARTCKLKFGNSDRKKRDKVLSLDG